MVAFSSGFTTTATGGVAYALLLLPIVLIVVTFSVLFLKPAPNAQQHHAAYNAQFQPATNTAATNIPAHRPTIAGSCPAVNAIANSMDLQLRMPLLNDQPPHASTEFDAE